jgi:hypothetical protein
MISRQNKCCARSHIDPDRHYMTASNIERLGLTPLTTRSTAFGDLPPVNDAVSSGCAQRDRRYFKAIGAGQGFGKGT